MQSLGLGDLTLQLSLGFGDWRLTGSSLGLDFGLQVNRIQAAYAKLKN